MYDACVIEEAPSPMAVTARRVEAPRSIEAPWAYEPLSPAGFLVRSALVYGDRTAVSDGGVTITYAELEERCRRLAGSFRDLAQGRPVAVLAPNGSASLEAHYSVPWSGSPLVALNIRLAPSELSYIVEHSGAGVLVHDVRFAETAGEIRERLPGLRLVSCGEPDGEYEQFALAGPALQVEVADERGLLAINYTSGTTGKPKGVMYHHRGAYLQALAMVAHAGLTSDTRYLWTLPMFHCNGWCFTWAVTAAGGQHLCPPSTDPASIWEHARSEKVSHLCAAPTVLNALAAAASSPLESGHVVKIMVGGSPPNPSVLARLESLGAEVTHLYGLTETFGPIVVCDWRSEWDGLPAAERARLKARQGVGNVIACPVRVVDANGADVPPDATTLGEIAVRGNDVMLGYYKDEAATRAAIPDGWLRTGDLGVVHGDGYLEIRDRSKDIIISGGENISSVEVEQILAGHPAVLQVAVIAVPDEHWGEVPAAFVTLRPGATADGPELIGFARQQMAHFKAPKHVIFGDLPITATGKVQKFVLRERAGNLLPNNTSG